MSLNDRQWKFVEAYTGNATEAARKAGYRSPNADGARLMRDPEVKAEIRKRNEEQREPLIASRKERQRFWTSVMQDRAEEMKDRLKASELLGRSCADFTDKVNVSGTVTLEQLVMGSLKAGEESSKAATPPGEAAAERDDSTGAEPVESVRSDSSKDDEGT